MSLTTDFQKLLTERSHKLMVLNDIYRLHSYQDQKAEVQDEKQTFNVPELHKAVFEGKTSTVKKLISKHGSINEGIPDGPKYVQERKGNETVMNGFFKGTTPLMIACQRGNMKLATLLVEKGAIINKSDGIGLTPFAYACAGNHLHICTFLRRHGALIEIRDDKFGMTPLHIACRMGHTTLAKWLSANGSNIHTCDYHGRSTLHFAAWNYNIELIEYLVNKNVKLNSRDKHGDTPLHYIVSNKDLVPNSMELYFCSLEYETAAAIIGQISSVNDYDIDVDIYRTEDRDLTSSKLTDVWHATFALIKAGANPNAINYVGETPLHVLVNSLPPTYLSQGYAIVLQAKEVQEAIVQMLILLKMGADPEVMTSEGKSATDFCHEQENHLAVKILNKYTDSNPTMTVEHPELCNDFITRHGAKYLQKERVLEKTVEELSDMVLEPCRRRSVFEFCRDVLHSLHRYIDEVIVG